MGVFLFIGGSQTELFGNGKTFKKRVPKIHFVVKDGCLIRIAKKYYGNAIKYPLIFDANKPMLTHPDKIYLGQVLRIPKLN